MQDQQFPSNEHHAHTCKAKHRKETHRYTRSNSHKNQTRHDDKITSSLLAKDQVLLLPHKIKSTRQQHAIKGCKANNSPATSTMHKHSKNSTRKRDEHASCLQHRANTGTHSHTHSENNTGKATRRACELPSA